MNILALETSSRVLSVALQTGTRAVTEETLPGFLTHAENLLPLIDRLLKKEKIKIRDIDTFLIGRGPGSFTGLRIGFATLKGFLAPEKKNCYGALSLDMIAEKLILPEESRLGVCVNAFRQRIYARFYQRRQGFWIPEDAVGVLTFPELTEKLSYDTYITGDALTRFQKDFEDQFAKERILFLPESYWYPSAAVMVSCFENGCRQFERGGVVRPALLQKLKKPADFLPLYFRLSEAEENRRDYANIH